MRLVYVVLDVGLAVVPACFVTCFMAAVAFIVGGDGAKRKCISAEADGTEGGEPLQVDQARLGQ